MKKKFLSILPFLFCIVLYAENTPVSENRPQEDQRKFDYFFLEALRLKEKEEPTNALHALQYALKIDSTSSAALNEMAQFYLYLDRKELAWDALQKAVLYAPDNFEYKSALADLGRELGKKETIGLYEDLVKAHPDKPELHYYLSNLYMQQNEIDKAIGALNGLENNMGVNESISLQKYQLYKSINKREEALKELMQLADKFPAMAKYQILIGDFYLEEKKADKALLYYEKAISIDPDDPFCFIAMSNYYDYKGDDAAAMGEIEKALKNTRLDIETKLGILGQYVQNLETTQKGVEKANSLFETLMAQHPHDKELNRMYGQFLVSQNKLEEAKFQFQIVTEAIPDDLTAWMQLLGIVLKENDPDEIILVCSNARNYFPYIPEFYFYEGISYSIKKEYEQALAISLEGVKVAPTENQTLLSAFFGQIGDIYYQLNQQDEAFEAYDLALQYNEKNVPVLNNYAYHLALMKKDLDKAERMAAAVMRLQPDNPTYIDTYAWVLFQRGNYSLARFYIESAVSKDNSLSSDILEHYGDILYKTGDTEKAVLQWEKALEIKEKEGENTDELKKKIDNQAYFE
ncbi:MAG: tetratricopeptide repeat protein [Candidatus Azobacteroides sp.]|nr:tetratricopeptide repeat protein [Candidatus Azobacteroides sp.]